MSDLGDLLELIHGAHSRLVTLEAEYRDWMRPRPSLDLAVERSELGEPQIRWQGGGPFPRTAAAARRIWLRAPDRVRVEVMNGRQLVRIGVRDGSGWLRWDRVDGVESGSLSDVLDGRAGMAPPLLFPPLLEPAQLLAPLLFEPVGKTTRAGREVLAARARARYPSLTAERLSYEFEFDAGHGTVLRRATLERGEPVSVTEAVIVRYNNSIEPKRFELVPPVGLSPRPVHAES